MITLFPLRFQTAFVRKVVTELRSLPSQKQRNDLMIRVVSERFRTMTSVTDDDDAVERDLIAFADDVWRRVSGERRGGAA
jgi:hypothetical protein